MSFQPISALRPHLKSSTTGKVACGLSLGLALISAENPIFEMASNKIAAAILYDFGGYSARSGVLEEVHIISNKEVE
jgi:hypothetical protein